MALPAVKLTPDPIYRANDAAKLLGISRASFFRIVFFKDKKVIIGERSVGYLASDLALYQSLRRGL